MIFGKILTPKQSEMFHIRFLIISESIFFTSFLFEFTFRMNRNIFNNSQSTNIFNNSNTSNNNNNNNNSNNNSGQSSNIFTRSQANNQNNSSNSQNNRNVFAQNNSNGSSNNQGTNIFNNQNSSSNIFTNNQSNQNNNNNNNNSNNNIFNNSNNQGGNIFNNNNNQGANIFNNNNNQGGNLFNNNRQTNNIFSNNQNNNNNNNNNNSNNNNYNNYNNNNNNPFFFQDPMLGINFAGLNPEEQKYVFSKLSLQQIRNYIEHHLKMMNESNKLQNIRLSRENSIKGQKINKFATDYNIKKEILHIKKTIKDNVCAPVKNLKIQHEKMVKQSFELISNLLSSLEKEKRKLIGVIQEEKMSKDIKTEFQQINSQIEDFIRPLYNSHTKGGNFTFVDPDAFCIHISEQILKKITSLDSKLDDLISCQHQNSQESESLVNTIEQLLAYFENVAIEFQNFNAKYNELKRRKLSNHQATLEKIDKKAANIVTTEMKSYKLIKEIEQILQKRIKKANQ